MLCKKCNKRPAVIFTSRMENGKSVTEGFCVKCAKELNIANVDQMLSNIGISEEMIENMEETFSNMAENGELEELQEKMPNFKEMFNYTGGSDENHFENIESKDSKDKKGKKEKKDKKPEYKFLSTYCTNLNDKAKEGNIDRVIGRENETSRVIQILCRRQKNNPCLIGEPGVGKTAIAEGLAIAINNKKVPYKLEDKEVYLLDLASLVAGTQFRGQFESRIKGLISDIVKKKNAILVIDEVHTLVGTGDSEGSMSAANILKPALSRGEIQVIGATTFEEYRKYIEKDAALERRFQPVSVEEPSIADTIEIIKGVKDYYEDFHKVIFTDEVIEKGVKMSERYITDRFLPDKAIDLFDEAASRVSINSVELNNLEKAKKRLERENSSLKTLEELTEKNDETYKQIADLKADIINTENEINSLKDKCEIKITVLDLAKVIQLWTGIDAAKAMENDFDSLRNLEKELDEIIIGQEDAIKTISNAVKRSKISLSAVKRPASFIFVGATGVGKTFLVKTLAEKLFDKPDALIRFDMSEFMEKHSVSRIIGSPPGYVGYDEAGQLTEKIRRRPYSLILFDEIEKAHADVLNILLQVLDEGHITDAQGRRVDFSNTIIVMTSNAGSEKKGDIVGFNRTANEMAKEKAQAALSNFLRPEFINRVDEVVVFNKLTKENIETICVNMLDELKENMMQKGIGFTYDENIIKYLCSKANFEKFGARDLRRVIQKEVEDEVVNQIISSDSYIKNICFALDKESLISIAK